MKLKGKILSLSLIPVVVLGISMFLVAADRIANGIYDEAYVGMQATTLAVRDIFEEGNSGAYHMDENGMLWKGDSLNISQATDITDHIKENTGMDVTVFWGDTIQKTSEIFREVCSGVDQSAEGMDTILANSNRLEDVRTDTIAIVQDSASLSEENSASIEEIMASIENIYHELGDISEKTKTLNAFSKEMTASVDIFHTSIE